MLSYFLITNIGKNHKLKSTMNEFHRSASMNGWINLYKVLELHAAFVIKNCQFSKVQFKVSG